MARTTLVTGGASGIGAAVRDRLRARGERVVVLDRAAGSDVRADLSIPQGRRSAIAEVLAAVGGRLDAVVTCAGLSGDSPLVPAVNYFGSSEIIDGLRPALAAGEPRVVIIGSVSGTHPVDDSLVRALLDGDVDEADRCSAAAVEEGRASQLYPSSKSAITQWARRTAVSPGWADAGIAVNVIAPGVVRTPMTTDLFADPRARRVMDRAVPMPLHGHAGPEAVAHVVDVLASSVTTHVTGQVLYVDGGAETVLRGPRCF